MSEPEYLLCKGDQQIDKNEKRHGVRIRRRETKLTGDANTLVGSHKAV